MRILKERFIDGKMEVTMEEQNLIDAEMTREMNIYPVLKTIKNLKKIEDRWKRQNKQSQEDYSELLNQHTQK